MKGMRGHAPPDACLRLRCTFWQLGIHWPRRDEMDGILMGEEPWAEEGGGGEPWPSWTCGLTTEDRSLSSRYTLGCCDLAGLFRLQACMRRRHMAGLHVRTKTTSAETMWQRAARADEAMLCNAETRNRTGDLQIFSLTLSQLSYHGLAQMVGR